ncbi:transposase, partial [Streptomyces sp. PSKA54]
MSWTRLSIKDHTYLQARFAEADCRSCPDRAQCTTSATGPRSIAVLPQPLHEIQMRNRLDQRTEQCQRRYAIRADNEATSRRTSEPTACAVLRRAAGSPHHIVWFVSVSAYTAIWPWQGFREAGVCH